MAILARLRLGIPGQRVRMAADCRNRGRTDEGDGLRLFSWMLFKSCVAVEPSGKAKGRPAATQSLADQLKAPLLSDGLVQDFAAYSMPPSRI